MTAGQTGPRHGLAHTPSKREGFRNGARRARTADLLGAIYAKVVSTSRNCLSFGSTVRCLRSSLRDWSPFFVRAT
jgi:hypothetical protein